MVCFTMKKVLTVKTPHKLLKCTCNQFEIILFYNLFWIVPALVVVCLCTMCNRKTKIYLTSLLLILLLSLILNSYHKKISENGYCIPKQKIVFHKTHKCSTTTVQNILLRYAKKHSLHLALPNEGYFLGEPEGFSEKFHTENSILHNIFKVQC